MYQVFNVIPGNFFSNLSSKNKRIYADCLQLIYQEYQNNTLNFRLPRKQLQDVIAGYFLETKEVLLQEDDEDDDGTAASSAAAVLRRFCRDDIGWLEEEIDDATYERQIVMSENGIALAKFLNQLESPQRAEYANYIFDIYNTLRNKEQWKEHPYVNGLKNIFQKSSDLSGSLRELSTFIRKIIEKMNREGTLTSLTENIIEYFNGDFIKEYSRLTKQQNIHIYRSFIRNELDKMLQDDVLFNQIVDDCSTEEDLKQSAAEDKVLGMIQAAKNFLEDDYDQIMQDIKHKINLYIQVALARIRFIQNRDEDVQGSVNRTIKYLVEEMDDLGMKEQLPSEMSELFNLQKYEYIDKDSIRYPRKNKVIKEQIVMDYEELSQETIDEAKQAQIKEAYNPYSKKLMKKYIDSKLDEKGQISSDDLPMGSKNDLLADLAAVAYGNDNGYDVELLDGYYEVNNMLIRRFKLTKLEDKDDG